MNHFISLVFNFRVTTLGLKSQTNTNRLKYRHAYTQTHKKSFIPWPLDGQCSCTIKYPRASMTHRLFICFKCPLQQLIQSVAKSDQMPSCSLIRSALFLQGLKTLHPSCDGSRVGVIQHVPSDGSCSIFLSLSCTFLCGTCYYCRFPR